MRRAWNKLITRWIPGIIAGGADNDPAGIATYSLSGAAFGYQQLWLVLLSTPMLIAVQAMCARLGDLKRKGLMAIIRDHYAPIFAVVASSVLVISNTATLGADMAGVADALGLLTGIAFQWWVAPVALFVWYIVVFKNFAAIEKYLLLLTVVFLSYIISGLLAQPNWNEVVRGLFIPSVVFSPSFFVSALALMGTTVTPFLFFWQSKHEVEEHKSSRELRREAKQEDASLAPGFVYSNFVSLFIIISTAAVLHSRGLTTISSAVDAARSLEPFAGVYATYLFAFGIIGSGLLAIPILAASTSYVVAETFGWRDSLSSSIDKAKGFYTVLSGALFVGVGIAVSGISPIKALLYSQVLNGILTPILIVLVLFLCNDKKVVGDYVNGWFDNLFGWLAVMVIAFATAGLFWQLLVS